MKFLIDECLSPELAQMAHARGYGESSHVVWLDRNGTQDWNLLPFVLDGDWTFVTRNAYDFRGPADAPGAPGQYQRAEIHAGLICLNGPDMDIDIQRDLFEAVLDAVADDGDLVNTVLEATLERDAEEILIDRYLLVAEI